VATLKYHDRPVLSVAACGVRSRTPRATILAATGATDGSIALFDVSVTTDALGIVTKKAPVTLKPSFIAVGAHQSGVNGIALSCLDFDAFAVASGGDDQVLRAELFSIVSPFDDSVSNGVRGSKIVSLTHVSTGFAHSAAIKGVRMLGGFSGGSGGVGHGSERAGTGRATVATASHDQRIRVWSIATDFRSIEIVPIAGTFVECPEPEGVDGFIDWNGNARFAVCGRGVQTFEFS
jgi:WD40 repeat protein